MQAIIWSLLSGLFLKPGGIPHSYGYRLNRSAPDAIRYLCEGISIPHSLPWILKGDIHQCFDMISHQWFYENIPIETSVLTEFLSCGYIEGWQFNHSEEGVMQGGYISPILANMALDGMESLLNKNTSWQMSFDLSGMRMIS
jgi:RNA-directed DNA polymerase